MRKLLILLSLSLLTACSTVKNNEKIMCEIPKDTAEVWITLNDQLSIETRMKIITNEPTKENLKPLILWLSERWQISDELAYKALKDYRSAMDPNDSYELSEKEFVTIYDSMDDASHYLFCNYADIPKLEHLNINWTKFPEKPRVIIYDFPKYLYESSDITLAEFIKDCDGSTVEMVKELNNLKSENMREIAKKKDVLLVPGIVYPPIFQFLENR